MFVTDINVLEKFYEKKRMWQGVPGIERTKSGRIFVVLYSGTANDDNGNYCAVLKSDDDGESFSEPICGAYAGEMNRCFDPVLWIDPVGRLWFTWAQSCKHGVYGVICDNPDADELIWSDEFFIGRDSMMNKPTVLSTGEWLFPISVWDLWCFEDSLRRIRRTADYNIDDYLKNRDPYSGANVFKSVDNGKTIKMIGGCRHIQSRSCDEPMIYEKENGVLIMLIRTRYGIARSCSYDRGETWTVAENSGIAGPSSRFHIRRLKSGRLILINHDNFTGRNNLTAFLSEDDGETWKYKLLLDERNEVSYPDMTEGEDGYLYIIYDRESGGGKSSYEEVKKCAREILLTKINETDILAGSIVSKESYAKKIVSKLSEYEGETDFFDKYVRINPAEFADAVIEYDSIDKILDAVFEYYCISNRNMHCADVKKIDEIIGKIMLCYDDKASLKKHITKLTEILSNVRKSTAKMRDEPLVNNLITHLHENINEEIDINKIAEEVNVSVYYLCHLFKRKTGLSVYEYRNACRFAEAKRLLVSTDLKIVQICAQCGFSDSSYFTKKFKESEHITPKEYRNLHRRR